MYLTQTCMSEQHLDPAYLLHFCSRSTEFTLHVGAYFRTIHTYLQRREWTLYIFQGRPRCHSVVWYISCPILCAQQS